MGKADDKGEPVKTVTIGGKKVEVPIIFVLPEETGEKEIERYQHPKVHIESKKIAPLLAGAGAATGIGAAGKKIGEGIKDTAEQAPQAIGEGAKLSETLSSESEEKPLDKLTHGKLEEVEKLPFPVPKEKDSLDQPDDAVAAKDSENEAILRHALGKPHGVRDTIVAREGEPTREKKIPFESGRAMKAWVSWLQKKKEWDKKEREKDKVMQEQRVARQTHVDEEMSGIGSKQHKEEARAIREGKVAPSRTATIAAERPWDLEKPSSDKKVTAARLLHEFKGFGKAQALKRIKEQQDKRRAEEEKALYIEGGAREKDIANQSKKELEKARIRHRDGSITEEEGTEEEITAKLDEHNKIPAKERPKFTTADIGDTSKKIGQGEPCWICEAHKLGIGTPVPRSDAEDVGGAYAKHLKEHEGFSATPSTKSWESWLQKKEEWDKEESEWEQIGDTNRWRKKRKKKLQDAEEDLDINFDDSDAFGIDKLKALQLEIKDALKPEKNQGKMSTEEFGGRSGRNSKTGRELNDYLESQQPYGFGKLGKKEPQTSRGQADDATQERAMNYYSAKDPRSGRASALKKPAREAGENTVRGDARIDQHEPKSHETASSGNDWKSSNRVGREMYDQEPVSEIKEEDYDKEGKLSHHKIREVPRGGKAPRDSPEPLGRKAQFTGNEKLMRQMAGYPPSYFEDTYDKEEERRRDAKLPKTGKSPKGTKVRKKAWEKWMVRL